MERTPYQQDLDNRIVDLDFETAQINLDMAKKRLKVVETAFEVEKLRLDDFKSHLENKEKSVRMMTVAKLVDSIRPLRQALASFEQALEGQSSPTVVTVDRADLQKLIDIMKFALDKARKGVG